MLMAIVLCVCTFLIVITLLLAVTSEYVSGDLVERYCVKCKCKQVFMYHPMVPSGHAEWEIGGCPVIHRWTCQTCEHTVIVGETDNE